MNREQCLNKAIECVTIDRNNTHGEPEDNFALISKLWTDYLDTYVDEKDVCMMMCLLKIARIRNGVSNVDSYVDICGYSACACEVIISE